MTLEKILPPVILGIVTSQMCWVHHHREGQPETRNISSAEAALASKSSRDEGGLGTPHRNAAQWSKVAPIPHSSNFRRSMATLFPMCLSPLRSDMLEIATAKQKRTSSSNFNSRAFWLDYLFICHVFLYHLQSRESVDNSVYPQVSPLSPHLQK